MYVLPEGRVAYFDVDDTLVEWKETSHGPRVKIELNGMVSEKVVIEEHVEELQLQKKSGTAIVVWSAGGVKWAEAVVKALGIEEYVDVILTKPDRIYDDKDPSDWMPKSRYFKKNKES